MTAAPKEEILEFIHRRFKNEDMWLTGNCYWFAEILCTRFPHLQIYYEPIVGHFYAGTKEKDAFYDQTGLATPYAEPILFDTLLVEDELLYARLIRDCVN